jgi:hypothetical protein
MFRNDVMFRNDLMYRNELKTDCRASGPDGRGGGVLAPPGDDQLIREVVR